MYKKYIDVHFFNHYIFVNFADLILECYGTETVYTKGDLLKFLHFVFTIRYLLSIYRTYINYKLSGF